MKASHTRGGIDARFDHRSLVSDGGLVPVMRLAQDADLHELADQHVRLGGSIGANAGAKIASIVAGMACGADSIDGLDVIRHGGLPLLFHDIKAPSTLGSFLRHFGIGHLSQLQRVARATLVNLTRQAPLLPGADQLAFLDIDSKTQLVHSKKQGAAYGHKKILGLDYQLTTLCTPLTAPVILDSRLRGGNAHSARKAASLLRTSLATARACGATGNILVRMDSAFLSGQVITETITAGAWFSITARHTRNITAAIHAIDEPHWQPVTLTTPIHDEDTGEPITHAEIAETSLTILTNITHHPSGPVTVRLIVRRTPRTTPDSHQQPLFPAYRHYAILTNSPLDPVQAEAYHRQRAGSIEHVLRQLTSDTLAHFPSHTFITNTAWLILATLTHNLLRATGCLAGPRLARAHTTTLRRTLIHTAAQVTRQARRITLRLPTHWPWRNAWLLLFDHAHAPPPAPHP